MVAGLENSVKTYLLPAPEHLDFRDRVDLPQRGTEIADIAPMLRVEEEPPNETHRLRTVRPRPQFPVVFLYSPGCRRDSAMT